MEVLCIGINFRINKKNCTRNKLFRICNVPFGKGAWQGTVTCPLSRETALKYLRLGRSEELKKKPFPKKGKNFWTITLLVKISSEEYYK